MKYFILDKDKYYLRQHPDFKGHSWTRMQSKKGLFSLKMSRFYRSKCLFLYNEHDTIRIHPDYEC